QRSGRLAGRPGLGPALRGDRRRQLRDSQPRPRSRRTQSQGAELRPGAGVQPSLPARPCEGPGPARVRGPPDAARRSDVRDAGGRQLRLWFSEGIEPAFSSVALFGPAGRAVPAGPLSLDPKDRAQVVVPINAPLAPGTYRVRWAVVSVDTHRTQGDYAFTVKP